MINLRNLTSWQPPESWLRITTVDAHAEGEPLRVIASGYPDLPGATILDRRRYATEHLDHLRTALMWEPRGHADMYGCIITAPVSPRADFGVLFLHNDGYSTMCGHGIIAVSTVAVATGMVDKPDLRIDTPAGLITSHTGPQGVQFDNVPSFAAALDAVVDVPSIGQVRFDLGFGGAFYAVVDARSIGLACELPQMAALIDAGMRIKRAITASHEIRHPFEQDLSFLYGTIFVDSAFDEHVHSRNVCIFANGEVDRSPTGTGVSARAAIHAARGELGVGQTITIESIVGSRFTVAVKQSTRFGSFAAVIPTVGGRAYLTGRNEFWIDPADPFGQGFWLR